MTDFKWLNPRVCSHWVLCQHLTMLPLEYLSAMGHGESKADVHLEGDLAHCEDRGSLPSRAESLADACPARNRFPFVRKRVWVKETWLQASLIKLDVSHNPRHSAKQTRIAFQDGSQIFIKSRVCRCNLLQCLEKPQIFQEGGLCVVYTSKHLTRILFDISTENKKGISVLLTVFKSIMPRESVIDLNF